MGFLKKVPVLRKIIEIAYTFFLIIVLSVIVGLILSFPVMWLWNYVFINFPKLHINVFQAWALNILCGILFGNKGSGDGK